MYFSQTLIVLRLNFFYIYIYIYNLIFYKNKPKYEQLKLYFFENDR